MNIRTRSHTGIDFRHIEAEAAQRMTSGMTMRVALTRKEI
jgi:hypothetical protein